MEMRILVMMRKQTVLQVTQYSKIGGQADDISHGLEATICGQQEELIDKAYKDSEKSGREYEKIVRYIETIIYEF